MKKANELNRCAIRISISAVVSLLSGLRVFYLFRFSPSALARHGIFIDDAYFYTVLAKNLRKFGFLTLDGKMPTNGVQPLWIAIQSGLGYIFPDIDGVTILAWSSALVFMAFAFFLTYYLTDKNFWITIFSVSVPAFFLFWNPEFHRTVLKGLETPVALFIIAIGILNFEWLRRKLLNLKEYKFLPEVIVLGVISALIFFARTDMFWFAVVIFGWLIYTEKRISWNLSVFSLTVASLVIPYLIFNLLTAGSLMPISGRVKLFYLQKTYPTFQNYIQSGQWTGMFHLFDRILGLTYLSLNTHVRYIFILVLILASLYCLWRFRKKGVYPSGLNLLAIVIIPHILFMHLFYRELRSYTSYYFVPEILFFVLFLAFTLKALARNSFSTEKNPVLNHGKSALIRRIGAVLIFLWAMIIFTGETFTFELNKSEYWTKRLELAKDITQKVPKGSEVGAFWPGLFAHFSERTIVPLDGIIGSEYYFEKYVRNGRELDYILERDIDYLAIYLTAPLKQKNHGLEDIHWSGRGEKLLRDNPGIVEEVVSYRLIKKPATGWYLLKINQDYPINKVRRGI